MKSRAPGRQTNGQSVPHDHALRRIESALHRLELSFIMPLPPKYHPIIAENQPKFGKLW
jgi:hypothetical protein